MISPRLENFTESYIDQVLDPLFLHNSGNKKELSFIDAFFSINIPIDLGIEFREINKTLVIASDTLMDDELISELQKAADRGIRIYLLLSDRKENKKAIDALAGRCCIRTGVSQAGSLILVDQKDGWILSNNLAKDNVNSYRVSLDSAQVDAYHRIYSHLFWLEAKYEYLKQGAENRLEIKEKPVESIDLNHRNPFPDTFSGLLETDWINAEAVLTDIDESTRFWNILDADNIEQNNCCLWLTLNQCSGERLKNVYGKAGDIFLTSAGFLPQILKKDNGCWLLPKHCKKEALNWGLQLSDQQMDSIDSFLDLLYENERWEFKPQLTVSDLVSPFRYLNKPETEYTCLEMSKKDLGEIECRDYESYENISAQELCKNSIGFLAEEPSRSTNYSVSIYPPYLSEKAKQDPLYQKWKNCINFWQKETKRMEDNLGKIESSTNGLTEKIGAAMKLFIVGQSNSGRQLKKGLAELKEVDFLTMRPSERDDKVSELNQLIKDINNRAGKLSEETDKTEQKLAWENEKNKCTNNLDQAKEHYDKAESEQSQFTEKYQQERINIEQKLIADWNTWLGNASSEKIIEKELEKLKSFKPDEIQNWSGKNNNNLGKKQKKLHRKLMEDYKQSLRKLDDEQKRLKNNTERCEKAVETANRELNNLGNFVWQPKPETGLSKLLGISKDKKEKTFTITWPGEELPIVGELYQHKNKRFLAINQENMVAQAKIDAQRLNAGLVVKKES